MNTRTIEDCIIFLDSLTDEIHVSVIDTGVGLLKFIYNVIPKIPMPSIGVGPDGMIGMTWQTNEKHLNIEVYPDLHLELFFENLVTGELWSQDTETGISPEFIRELKSIYIEG